MPNFKYVGAVLWVLFYGISVFFTLHNFIAYRRN